MFPLALSNRNNFLCLFFMPTKYSQLSVIQGFISWNSLSARASCSWFDETFWQWEPQGFNDEKSKWYWALFEYQVDLIAALFSENRQPCMLDEVYGGNHGAAPLTEMQIVGSDNIAHEVYLKWKDCVIYCLSNSMVTPGDCGHWIRTQVIGYLDNKTYSRRITVSGMDLGSNPDFAAESCVNLGKSIVQIVGLSPV